MPETTFTPNIITPLKCSSCNEEMDFAAHLDNLDFIKDVCNICYLSEWFKHEPLSGYCPKCNSEMKWTGMIMMSPEIKSKINQQTLCSQHQNFKEK